MAPAAHWIRAAAAATSNPSGCAVEMPPAIRRGRLAATRRSAISFTDSGGMPASRDTFSTVVRGKAARSSPGSRIFGDFRSRTSRSRKERRSGSRPGGVGVHFVFGEPSHLQPFARGVGEPGEGAGRPAGQEEILPPLLPGCPEGSRHPGEGLLPGDGPKFPSLPGHGTPDPLRVVETVQGGLAPDAQPAVVHRMPRDPVNDGG